ncbi:hypothetical protein B0T26DRAFT_674944 [Lasiosphaeria miniovina]|uniref:Uncharacterized protein n=1 Tax=Lasiosphaeria miniovina TaxID=1954250 RepID=A0AA40E0G0_9PEZI|nr:uncharacterized protein B0T26DRAFT_674944 [Lasiosphaeria miniovina]KAK0723364.1 hypothetical protein B0T26DRAFT_674944 [Lasiosphaeria miniovina]
MSHGGTSVPEQPLEPNVPVAEPPPDGGYGWVIVGSCCGLAWSLRVTGLVTMAANGAATLLLGFDVGLLRRREVVLLLLWAFVSMFWYIVLLFSLSDYALQVGLPSSQATDVVGLLNIRTAVGRPVIGIVSDRWSRTVTAVICFALWIPANSFGLAVAFAVLRGAILGIFWMTIGPLCVEVAGLRNLQSLLSLSWAAVVVPTTLAEVMGLRLREIPAPRPYLYARIFAGLAYMIASIFMFALWRVIQRRETPAWL